MAFLMPEALVHSAGFALPTAKTVVAAAHLFFLAANYFLGAGGIWVMLRSAAVPVRGCPGKARSVFQNLSCLMPNADSLSAVAQGQLIQTVDTGRAAGDRFKMPAADRTLFDSRLADLQDKDNDTALTESDRAGGSSEARAAIDRLKELLHDGYRGIAALRSTIISDGQRLELFTLYGWAGGKLGDFSDARTIGLARLGVSPDVVPENPAWAYAADLKADIAAQLAIVDAKAEDRTGGARMEATRARNGALELFGKSLSRYRHYLCSASDDLDQSPELRRAGFKVRKDRTAAAKKTTSGESGGTPPPTK